MKDCFAKWKLMRENIGMFYHLLADIKHIQLTQKYLNLYFQFLIFLGERNARLGTSNRYSLLGFGFEWVA